MGKLEVSVSPIWVFSLLLQVFRGVPVLEVFGSGVGEMVESVPKERLQGDGHTVVGIEISQSLSRVAVEIELKSLRVPAQALHLHPRLFVEGHTLLNRRERSIVSLAVIIPAFGEVGFYGIRRGHICKLVSSDLLDGYLRRCAFYHS